MPSLRELGYDLFCWSTKLFRDDEVIYSWSVVLDPLSIMTFISDLHPESLWKHLPKTYREKIVSGLRWHINQINVKN